MAPQHVKHGGHTTGGMDPWNDISPAAERTVVGRAEGPAGAGHSNKAARSPPRTRSYRRRDPLSGAQMALSSVFA